MNILAIAATLMLIGSSPTYAAAAPDASRTQAWDWLTALSGDWRIEKPASERERAFRIRFASISKGSALVEAFGDPAGSVTHTVYHQDGARLMATHYCAQGNQPRLILDAAGTRGLLSFRFLDVSNLKKSSDSHLVKLEFRPIDADRLERLETYVENGVAEESRLRLVRDR